MTPVLTPESCALVEKELANILSIANQPPSYWAMQGVENFDKRIAEISNSCHAIRSEIAFNAVHPSNDRGPRKRSTPVRTNTIDEL